METKELIAELRKCGLANGGSLGWHSGLCDEAADVLEQLSIDLEETRTKLDNAMEDLSHCYAVCSIYENGRLISMTMGDGGRFERVVHAHWIMRGGRRYCSACGTMACVTRDQEDFWYTVGTKRCPECGAHMDEEVADES